MRTVPDVAEQAHHLVVVRVSARRKAPVRFLQGCQEHEATPVNPVEQDRYYGALAPPRPRAFIGAPHSSDVTTSSRRGTSRWPAPLLGHVEEDAVSASPPIVAL